MIRFALLATLLAACVNVPKFNGIGDAAATDAAPTGTVDVLARMRNGTAEPAVGIHVVLTDPAGTITSEADTTNLGEASGAAVDGGTLFAAYSSPPVLVVITNIAVGETYNIGEPHWLHAGLPPAAAMGMTRNASSTYYEGSSRCGSGAGPSAAGNVAIPFTWTDGCSSGDSVGVMALAANAAEEPFASRFFEVSYGVPAFSTALAWLPPTPVTVALTAPSDLQTLIPSVSAVNHDFAFGGPTPPMISTNGTTATPTYFATTPTDPLELAVTMVGGTKGAMIYFRSLPAGTSNVALDLSTTVRPSYVSDVVLPQEPAPVTWSETAGAAAQLALLVATMPNSDTSNPTTSTIRYFFEPTARSFTRPPIPDVPAFASFRGDADPATPPHLYTVRFPDDAVSYATARQMIDGAMFFGSTFSRPDRQLLALPGATAAFVAGSQ